MAGVVIDAAPREFPIIDSLEPLDPVATKKKHLWLLLDGVTDPHNVGAIIRSAFFLNACGVVLTARNSAPISAVAVKASAGAAEITPIAFCGSALKVGMINSLST